MAITHHPGKPERVSPPAVFAPPGGAQAPRGWQPVDTGHGVDIPTVPDYPVAFKIELRVQGPATTASYRVSVAGQPLFTVLLSGGDSHTQWFSGPGLPNPAQVRVEWRSDTGGGLQDGGAVICQIVDTDWP